MYTRLSLDRTGGFQTATARQDESCRAFALSRGWTVVDTFEDVDVSAYRKGVVRPSYRRLCDVIASGSVDGVLVWKLDRLVRRPADFERFWELCEDAGVFVASVTEPIDSSTDLGLALVRILVTFASLESATTSLRLKEMYRHAAKSGKPPIGRRGFATTQKRDAVIEHEAVLVREAAARVVSGESADAIAREWNERGVPAPQGDIWYASTLKTMLRSPRLAGHRVHLGEVVRRDCMPTVLDAFTSAKVEAVLADRHRRFAKTSSRTLLGGIARCGRCGCVLTWSTSPHSNYVCGTTVGCRGLAISAHLVEGFVTARLWSRVERGALGRAALSTDEAIALLDATRIAFEMIPATLCDDERLAVEARRADLLDNIARTDPLDPVARYGRRLRRVWPRLSVPERQGELRRHVRRVVVRPASRPGPFNSDRIEMHWW